MRAQFVESNMLSELKQKGIQHGFFTRKGGVSKGIFGSLNAGMGSGDVRSDVMENRKRVCEALDIPINNLITPHQTHSNHVAVVTDNLPDKRPKADGIVTNRPKIAIGVVTADCGPILFADPENGVIGAAHAGWRGAFGGVLENTIAAMESLGAHRSQIKACLGPAISQSNYEVGPEFYQTFIDKNAHYATYFVPSPQKAHFLFDLHSFIQDRLNDSGVSSEILGICTYQQQDSYFSFRRTTHKNETDYGRQLSIIYHQ